MRRRQMIQSVLSAGLGLRGMAGPASLAVAVDGVPAAVQASRQALLALGQCADALSRELWHHAATPGKVCQTLRRISSLSRSAVWRMPDALESGNVASTAVVQVIRDQVDASQDGLANLPVCAPSPAAGFAYRRFVNAAQAFLAVVR